MKELALLLAIIGVLFYVLWKIGQRNVQKPLTLDDLDFRIQYAQLNELNAKGLRISINEMRTRITEKLNTALTEYKRLALECDLKRLESIERTFEFKFVEFLPGAKVINPDVEGLKKKLNKIEAERGIRNRNIEDPYPGEKETVDINLENRIDGR